MQLKRIAIWVSFVCSFRNSVDRQPPTVGNLARLEFLVQPTYFIYRTMSLDALIMIFGLMFLLSSSFPLDRKMEVKSLIMASPVTKWQYILGKLLGGFLYTVVMLTLFLVLNTIAYLIVAPFDVSCNRLSGAVYKDACGKRASCQRVHQLYPQWRPCRNGHASILSAGPLPLFFRKRFFRRIGGTDAVLYDHFRRFDEIHMAASRGLCHRGKRPSKSDIPCRMRIGPGILLFPKT